MKRLFVFLMAMIMMLAVTLPVGVSAYRTRDEVEDSWAGWQATGNAKIENGVGTVINTGKLSYSYSNQPKQFTVSFSMKITSFSSSMGFQMCDGINRAGFYMRTNGLRAMDSSTQLMPVPNITEWHDYDLEVDMDKAKQTLYVDGVLAGSTDLFPTTSRSTCLWWAEGTNSGLYEVENFKITITEEDDTGNRHKLTHDYTQPFFADFYEEDGFYFENRNSITHDKEKGILRLASGPLYGDHTNRILHTIEHPLNPPENYDFEWRINITDIEKLGGQPSATMLELSTGDRHTWIYIKHNKIWHNGYDDEGYDDELALPFTIQDNQWHTWKAEIRGYEVTWYLDGKLLMQYHTRRTETNRWHTVLWHQHAATLSAETYIDWMKYTPYFDETKVVSPVHFSEFVEGKEIVFKASVPEGCEYADFYMGETKIGRGYAPNYEYVLKDAKIGTYEVYVKAGNQQSLKNTVKVKADDYEEVADEQKTDAERKIFYLGGSADSSKALSTGQEYEANYKYTSGNGNFELTDGYFKYKMSHSDDKITYETIDGVQTYPLGKGKYKAVVTSGYAEVYHNGQFAFSFFMPRCSDATGIKHSGLADISVQESGVKAELWGTKWNQTVNNVTNNVPQTRYYSLEFDKTDDSEEKIVFYDGIFENELFFRKDGIYANHQLVLEAPKEEIKICEKVEPGYYRLTVGFGIAQLFRDNKYIGSYRCNKYGHHPQLRREMTNPSASTIISLKNTDDVFYHIEDFEGNHEFSYDEYFLLRVSHFSDGELPQMTQTLVKEGDNSYVTLDGTGSFLLNGFQRNGVFRFRAKAEKAKGKIFFVSRCGKSDTQNMIGYDYDAKQWYVDRYSSQNTHSVIAVSKTAAAPEVGKWHNYEIVCNDRKTKLLCDGVEVISFIEEGADRDVFYGKSGFGAKNGSLSVDDIYYAGENRVIAGMNMVYANQYKGVQPQMSIAYKKADGVVALSSPYSYAETSDNGYSWKVKSAAESPELISGQMVVLPNGNYVVLKEDLQSFSKISKDQGKTWEEWVPMWGEDFVPTRKPASSVGRLTATKDGKVFMVTSQGDEDYGYSDIWYSNNGAESWNKSETVLTTHNTGIIMNEATVVDTPRENEVWMYGRSDSGFLDYWISYDGGKTFDTTPHHSQLIQSETCYKILRDWRYDTVYYAIFHYDTEPVNEKALQMPRNKTALAISYDGMETWEYIGDLWESNQDPGTHTSDSNISLVDDHLYFRFSDYDGPAGLFTGSYDLTKMKTLKRHPQLHERYFVGFEAISDYAVNHCIVSKTDGKAWVYGNLFDATVEDGRIDVENIERMFGVTAKKEGSAIELTLGEGVVRFTEGSVEYTVNGEAKKAEKICMKNGLLDIQICAQLFGKVFRETENSYSVNYKSIIVDKYQEQLDGLV